MDQTPITVISTPKKKNKHDKIRMFIVYTIGSIILAIILYLSGVFSFLHVRLYKGDRISGEIAIMVNEQECNPTYAKSFYNDQTAVTITLEEVSDTSFEDDIANSIFLDNSIDGNYGVSAFSVTGGEEGYYTLTFAINKDKLYELTGEECVKNLDDDLHIRFKYFNKKWYFLTTLNLSVVIVSDEKGLSLDVYVDYFADNAERYKVQGNRNKSFYLNLTPIAGNSVDNTVEFTFGD
ncbi:MAG: hypothetical protein A2Y15_03285 [Clostridiales bacterium GWF2_36_10]|nr:MAG: hypothetical protein A2Y15_03285 [Clostridiales bacterium GWF2_36_10]HAN20158.1 hypothetical protein [Clostridiales bacterium]